MLNRMRLYFMLPDVASATSTADELLLARTWLRWARCARSSTAKNSIQVTVPRSRCLA
jgi:hypothetical protein